MRKTFSKYELLFLDKANSSCDPSQILILRFHIPKASLPLSPSLSNFTLSNCNSSSTHSSSCSSSVSFFCPTPLDHRPPQVFDIPNHMPSQANQIYYHGNQYYLLHSLYINHNDLWVKHATHQKAGSLRADSLSKLDSTVNSNSIFNTEYAKFSTKWLVLLHFYNFTCAYNHLHQPMEFPPEILSSTSVNLQLLILLLLVQKIILTIPTNTLFLYTSAIFHVPFLAYNHPNNLRQNVISTSAIWPIQPASRDQ